MNRELLFWRSGAAIVGTSLVIGALSGLLWSLIAPGEQFIVYTDGQYLPLPTESYHQFTSIAIFVLIEIVVAAGLSTACWHWRSIRGVSTVLVLTGGNALGALTAYLLGRLLVSGVDPATVGSSSANAIVRAAPQLGNAMVLVVQPAVAVLIYTFLAAWNGRPDLTGEESPVTAG